MTRPSTRKRPFRPARELAIAAAGLALSAVLVPAAVYLVGSRTLGAYGGDGPAAFAATLYGDLVHLEPPALLLTLSPLAALYIFRIVWRGLRPR